MTEQPVQIKFKRYSIGPREGALIRIRFSKSDRWGSSDLHPWPRYGDPTLSESLNELGRVLRGHEPKSELVAAVLTRAEEDVASREIKAPESLLQSHYLVQNDISSFLASNEVPPDSHVKVKMRFQNNLLPLLEWAAKNSKKLRIDFNESWVGGKSGLDQWRKEALLLAPFSRVIDFIEDPCQWTAGESAEIVKVGAHCGVSVAWDWARGLTPPPGAVIIYKPMSQVLPEQILRDERVVVTTSLGHPMALSWVKKIAARWPEEVHGLTPTPTQELSEGNWELLT